MFVTVDVKWVDNLLKQISVPNLERSKSFVGESACVYNERRKRTKISLEGTNCDVVLSALCTSSIAGAHLPTDATLVKTQTKSITSNGEGNIIIRPDNGTLLRTR